MKTKRILIWLAAVVLVLACALPARAEAIRDIKVEGNQRIETATVLSYLEIRKGDEFDTGSMDRALKNLYATGLFADVSLFQQGKDLIVKVAENPILNEIRYEGNKKIKSDDIKGEMQLKPRQVLTRTKVQADVDRLQEMYRVNGNFSAVIDPKIIKLDQNRVNLVFEISEGEESLITRINFVGNKHYSDDQLQKVIRSRETRWYRFWTSDDKYDPDRLSYDRELLRKYYLEHGYVDFRVASAVAELSSDRKDFFVTFTVEEGERYKVGKIDVHTSIPGLDPAFLKDSVTFKAGDWYKYSELETTVTKMTNELGNRQFAFVDIQPGVNRNRENRTVDIDFAINEGQKAYIENINISGNTRTLDEVIRREMMLVEGDPFNTDKLKKSQKNINDLGYFDKVDVKPGPGSAADKTNINVNVSEKSTGSLSVAGGFSTTDGALADFQIQEKNFLGRGQILSLASTIAQKRTEFDFSFTEPYFLKRDLSAGIDLFHTTADYQDERSYDSKNMGGGLRFGYPLSEHWRQNLNYRYDDSDIRNVGTDASPIVQREAGRRVTSMVSQILSYDTRDSTLDPTEGFVSRLTTDLAGAGGEAQYYRVKVGGTYYYPVADQWILSVLGETGYMHAWGGDTIRINERFYLGGDNLRGFDDSGIGPRDMGTYSTDALGGNRYWRASAQVDFPTGLPEDFGLRAHVFSDAGALWSLDEKDVSDVADSSRMRLSAGAGIAWKSPMGPMSFDLAKPILKEDFDKLRQFRLSFGTKF